MHFERRNDRGLFVYATPPQPAEKVPVCFWWAMRSVRKQDLDRLKDFCGPPDVPLTIVTRVRILYCPWCGVQLDWHYGNQYELLVDPAVCNEHELK
jgi:hypothetical protein